MGTTCSDARSTPNQSKSFRVLQQITDTMKVDPNETAALGRPAELHQPHYSRELGPDNMNEHQLRKLKLNENGKNLRCFCNPWLRAAQRQSENYGTNVSNMMTALI